MTMDMQLVPYLHPTLPWNNLDELSSLWAVFTKCKRQLRNGFRLENMTWRLWYRQAVMQKQTAPPSTILSPGSSTAAPSSLSSPLSHEEDIRTRRSLSRSQSLPNLRVPRLQSTQPSPILPLPQQQQQRSSPTTPTINHKFFIDDDSDNDDEDDYCYDDSSMNDSDDYWYNRPSSTITTSTMYSSTVSSVTSFHEDGQKVEEQLFSKHVLSSSSSSNRGPSSGCTAAKPTSLLSSMLLQHQQQQQQQQQQPVQKQEKAPTTSMLRRCKGFSQQLDSWFSKAAA